MKNRSAFAIALLLASLAVLHAAEDAPLPATADIVLADFEADTYGEWKVSGTAFRRGLEHGTLPVQKPVGGFERKGLGVG